MSLLNITPGKLDLEFYGGDDVHFQVKFKREVTPATDPVTYEYYLPEGTPRAMVRHTAKSTTGWELELTENTDDPENPFLQVVIPSDATAEMVVDQPIVSQWIKDELVTAPMFCGVWDLQFDFDGDIKTYVFGKTTAIGEVTR